MSPVQLSYGGLLISSTHIKPPRSHHFTLSKPDHTLHYPYQKFSRYFDYETKYPISISWITDCRHVTGEKHVSLGNPVELRKWTSTNWGLLQKINDGTPMAPLLHYSIAPRTTGSQTRERTSKIIPLPRSLVGGWLGIRRNGINQGSLPFTRL